jgi:hypothetical protein
MSIFSQRAGTDFCPVARLLHRSNWRPVFAAVLLALTLMVLPLQAQAAVDPQRWTLTDSSGHSWGLTLFEQPDPAYPAGRRLRLTARSPGQVVASGRWSEPKPVVGRFIGSHWDVEWLEAESEVGLQQALPLRWAM